MGKVIVGAALSLDGHSADRHGRLEPLYPNLAALVQTDMLQESIRSTGAVVMGRRTFDMGSREYWSAGDYEYRVPIFVVTHQPPAGRPTDTPPLTFTFVTEGVASAVGQARAAAGERDVTVVGGADVTRQILRAGLADEVHVDLMPVLLGGGLRPFDDLGAEPIRLERLEVRPLPAEAGAGTHLRFRVVKPAA
jgi:dihydrofolate reductase